MTTDPAQTPAGLPSAQTAESAVAAHQQAVKATRKAQTAWVALLIVIVVGVGVPSIVNNAHSATNKRRETARAYTPDVSDVNEWVDTPSDPEPFQESPIPPDESDASSSHQPPTDDEVAAAEDAGTQEAVITTSRGTIYLDLYGAEAPMTVANFIKLAESGFYDGLTFHRVETDSRFKLIQGGDPTGDGSGGPGYAIDLEIAPDLRHDAGAVAMARAADPDSAGSQFYICLVPLHELDDNYAVFGQVTDGLDVVKSISKGDKITSVTIR